MCSIIACRAGAWLGGGGRGVGASTVLRLSVLMQFINSRFRLHHVGRDWHGLGAHAWCNSTRVTPLPSAGMRMAGEVVRCRSVSMEAGGLCVRGITFSVFLVLVKIMALPVCLPSIYQWLRFIMIAPLTTRPVRAGVSITSGSWSTAVSREGTLRLLHYLLWRRFRTSTERYVVSDSWQVRQ